jgi:kumamolisin
MGSPLKLVPLAGSDRFPLPGARPVGAVDPNERLQVTIRVRHRPSNTGLANILTSTTDLPAQHHHLSREEYASQFGADPVDLSKVQAFVNSHGLTVVEISAARRSIVIEGTAAAMNDAFGVKLEQYASPQGSYRGRVGSVHLPSDLVSIVDGVFGLDDRQAATTHYRRLMKRLGTTEAQTLVTSFSPVTLAKLYSFPVGVDGQGQTIGIIELGGGFKPADLQTYFNGLGLPVPQVKAFLVDHAHNQPVPGNDSPDGEVMLDIEVAGACAPGATIVVYFAPNTDQGFLDAITTAIHDQINKPSIISISWGSPESKWTQQALTQFNQAFQAAAALGVTVCCAAGDSGSADMSPDDPAFDNLAHVDFPASSPFVLACGGTRLESTPNSITNEVVWNDGPSSATGGGISDIFDLPAYQQQAGVPSSANANHRIGRGVPDVAANADPETGYRVRVDGEDTVIGGTSAVAPLWSGLVALLNQSLGHPVGFLNPLLYQNPHALNDITQGSNGAYQAAAGWDACTGLGSPNGTKLLGVLQGSSVSGAVATTSVSAPFVPFVEFIRRTAAASASEHARNGARFSNASAFDDMKSHILSLYQGIHAVHTFVGNDGQHVDCIPIDQQPSLRCGSPIGSKVASPPTALEGPPPGGQLASGSANAVRPHLQPGNHDRFGNERFCPPGTIPMRRITLEEMTKFQTLNDYFKKMPLVKGHPRLIALDSVPHRYAHAYEFVNNNGGSSWLNLWTPIPTTDNFSLMQHWYTGGSGTGLQTVEGGWQVYPDHYNNSTKAVLFIYWTADGYNQTGNYNLDKPAFIQTNSNWVLGGSFDAYSVRDGDQREFRIHWQRDTSNGNWWLYLQGAGDLTAIGYYPQTLFGSGQMASCATEIDYGCEVTGASSGQMGSGAFASEGYKRAAYMRSICYFPTNGPASWATLTADATNPSCYTIDLHNNAPGAWATYFFDGGPNCG